MNEPTNSINGSASERALSRRGFVGLAAAGALSAASLSLFGCTPAQEGSLDSGALAKDLSSTSVAAIGNELYVSALMAGLSIEQKVAQLFVVTPEALVGANVAKAAAEDDAADGESDASSASNNTGANEDVADVTALTPELTQAIQALPVGGITFFRENLLDPAQATALLADLKRTVSKACGIPPLLSIDEEGGTVSRIGGNEPFGVENVGNMADIGATGDPARAKEVAARIAEYLEPIGFDTDFAPVCDVNSNPESDVMAKRAFAADAETVGRMVAAQVEGFEEADMICCLKHFPGLGAAPTDSHDSRISIDATLSQLADCELIPFRAGIEAGAPMVMMGHLSLPSITDNDIPASLSSAIVQDVLRDQLEFNGVIITDALEMSAIANFYSSGEAAVSALQAGCDLLLMPLDLQAAYDAVLEAVNTGALPAERFNESVKRVLRMKIAYGLA